VPESKTSDPVIPDDSEDSHKLSSDTPSGFIDNGSSGTGLDAEFPDGELDCSDFPDQYGAVKVPWLGFDGWTGIQSPGIFSAHGFDKIHATKTCADGSFCSYACPAGYQKVQWPKMQGLTGQSVGGLKCDNGKLYRTHSEHKTLCGKGTDKVDIKVVNKLSANAAVCRTDYPGNESENIPLDTRPGNDYPLTCPDSSTYYFWRDKQTSAQYYVNPAGTSVQDACQWGQPGSNIGNFAPVNLGVGYSDGIAWLSIMANAPTNPDGLLGFNIEIQGDDMNGKCRYENGQYCNGNECNSKGCTVSRVFFRRLYLPLWASKSC